MTNPRPDTAAQRKENLHVVSALRGLWLVLPA